MPRRRRSLLFPPQQRRELVRTQVWQPRKRKEQKRREIERKTKKCSVSLNFNWPRLNMFHTWREAPRAATGSSCLPTLSPVVGWPSSPTARCLLIPFFFISTLIYLFFWHENVFLCILGSLLWGEFPALQWRPSSLPYHDATRSRFRAGTRQIGALADTEIKSTTAGPGGRGLFFLCGAPRVWCVRLAGEEKAAHGRRSLVITQLEFDGVGRHSRGR